MLKSLVGVHSGIVVKISAAALILFSTGCRIGSEHLPAIGQAYVGPAVLKIRSDLPLQSPTTAIVKHGDRLEILQRRRIFLRVRTASGAEGWTEARQLLAEADMAGLKDLTERAAKMPGQGQATSYLDLNVHTEPAAQSPSFLRIKAKEKFDVLGHVTMPRTELPRAPLIPPVPKKPAAEKKDTKAKSKIPPVPMPKPPGPPPDWVELSKPALEPAAADELGEADANATDKGSDKPVPLDDWSLVRTTSGQTGWVLTRRITMAIPDEVAQYAEGHRIVSYFSLGKIDDGDERKDIWLWTTISNGVHSYDFDSFRVFVWSIRHHRFETAHIERNLQGHAPVLLGDVEYGSGAGGPRGKSRADGSKYPGFSVCVDNRYGQRVRKSYALLSNVVRFAGEQPCEPPAPPYSKGANASTASAPTAANQTLPATQQNEGLLARWKKRLKALLHR